MAILAECDICGNQHRVKDGLVGSSIRCKDCGVSIVVPDGHQITPDDFIEEGGRLRRREPDQPSASLWTWLFVGIVASLAVIALFGAVWALAKLIGSGPNQASIDSPGLQSVVKSKDIA